MASEFGRGAQHSDCSIDRNQQSAGQKINREERAADQTDIDDHPRQKSLTVKDPNWQADRGEQISTSAIKNHQEHCRRKRQTQNRLQAEPDQNSPL